MTKTVFAFVLLFLILFVAVAARADWDIGDSAKWVQLPDLDYITSLDVSDTHPKMLADDFECKSTGPITSIHIWGSWKGDNLPVRPVPGSVPIPDASLATFRLAIYADIPAADSPNGYSIPGELLWEDFFHGALDDYTVRPYEQALQGWYNPDGEEYIPADHYGVWQYNFYLDPNDPFTQLGTSDEPIIYWLSVDALLEGEGIDPAVVPEFGWKTSLDHWNDDAVWAESDLHDASGDAWQELYHPDPNLDFSLDLAFAIVPEPVSIAFLALGLVPVLLRQNSKRRKA